MPMHIYINRCAHIPKCQICKVCANSLISTVNLSDSKQKEMTKIAKPSQ